MLRAIARKISSIIVYDIVGKEVIIHSERESSEVNLDVSPLNNGIYFVEITNKNQLKITKKLVIDK
ncbi:MAG: T9SS type A sorting domain-containing protein [Flavobacterium sp.]|nr:T9SS type A sorting domain-containing protein [Flavobacterium sp.]